MESGAGRASAYFGVECLRFQNAATVDEKEVLGHLVPGGPLFGVPQSTELADHGHDVEADPTEQRHDEDAFGVPRPGQPASVFLPLDVGGPVSFVLATPVSPRYLAAGLGRQQCDLWPGQGRHLDLDLVLDLVRNSPK